MHGVKTEKVDASGRRKGRDRCGCVDGRAGYIRWLMWIETAWRDVPHAGCAGRCHNALPPDMCTSRWKRMRFALRNRTGEGGWTVLFMWATWRSTCRFFAYVSISVLRPCVTASHYGAVPSWNVAPVHVGGGVCVCLCVCLPDGCA